tara:strand:- start:9 stop:581 length:573 start_codon:yes stop_codon:yes gene_type:complete
MELRPIILCSGGVDSLALTVMAVTRGLDPLLLHIRYDHPAAREELEAVKKIHSAFAGSCKLRLQEMEINSTPMDSGIGEPGPRVVRGRNLMLIAAALNASQSGDYNQIWIGCTKEDDEHYWDCRDSFIHALNILIKDGVGVAAPLINMTRKQVLVMIPEPIQYLAWSCYQPYCGVPCGRCNSCLQGGGND